MNRYFRFYTMDIDAREALLDRIERLTDVDEPAVGTGDPSEQVENMTDPNP